MERDINWSVDFCITINSEEKSFEDLTDNEKEYILKCIKDDSYAGTFLGDEEEN